MMLLTCVCAVIGKVFVKDYDRLYGISLPFIQIHQAFETFRRYMYPYTVYTCRFVSFSFKAHGICIDAVYVNVCVFCFFTFIT